LETVFFLNYKMIQCMNHVNYLKNDITLFSLIYPSLRDIVVITEVKIKMEIKSIILPDSYSRMND